MAMFLSTFNYEKGMSYKRQRTYSTINILLPNENEVFNAHTDNGNT